MATHLAHSGCGGGSPRRKMDVIDEGKRQQIFGNIAGIRETIIKENEGDAFLVSAARSITSADMNGLLAALQTHPVAGKELHDSSGSYKKPVELLLVRLAVFQKMCLQGLISDKELTPDEISEYRNRKARFVKSIVSEYPSIPVEIPVTFKLVMAALNTLPDAILGKANADTFSSKMSWIGKDVEGPEKPGKIVLALSGGAAKGMFYLGFVRALRQNGIWPDIVIGTSAGAITSGGMGSGLPQETLEEKFSATRMKRIFSPYLAPLTLIRSGGSGVIGLRYGAHLHDVLGDSKFSENADCFVVAAVQQPTLFGKAVIGRSSERNGSISLSSDIPLHMGVHGSSSMQGIIPQPTVEEFTAERFERGLFGTTVHSMELPYATLDDGGVTEDLPIETAEDLLERSGSHGLILAVNLANLSPAKPIVPPPEGGNFLDKAKRAVKSLYENSIPMRAYNAFNLTFNSTVLEAVESSSGKGLKILLNPNSDGSLDGIDLLTFKGADAIVEYGYEMGMKLCAILLSRKV